MNAKHIFNGLLAFAGIFWILFTDRAQRKLYNESIGYEEGEE